MKEENFVLVHGMKTYFHIQYKCTSPKKKDISNFSHDLLHFLKCARQE